MLLSAGSFALAAERGAQAWQPVIAEYSGTPAYLIAVNKSRQELAFFERRSPLRLSRTFVCTTGQAVGDKEVEGDLKTPEGIYFVGYHIGSGLDFVKYGHEAYTLNYPNPVDRLRRKTGYGIWIHGRGEPLVPLQTEGCVAMENDDLALLGKVLIPGAPVVLAGSFDYNPKPAKEDEAVFRQLEHLVKEWAKAWSARSHSYFDFYNKEAYSIAQGEPFSAFQAQKVRLFAHLAWINTTVRDIQILPGPGYWVTWFYQDYAASNLTTRGVRRLYWEKNAKGELKIIGMEWQPGLSTATLLASADSALPPLEGAGPANAWTEAALRANAGTRPLPVAPARVGQASAPPSTPTSAPASAVEPVAEQAQGRRGGISDHIEDPRLGVMAKPSPEAFLLAEQLRASSVKGQAAAAAPAQPAQDRVASADADLQKDSRLAMAQAPSAALPPDDADEDAANLPAAPAAAPEPASDFPAGLEGVTVQAAEAPGASPAPSARAQGTPPATPVAGRAGASAASADLTERVNSISARVEAWRAAWESGKLESYMAFYAPDAKQGGRSGARDIRKQKEALWRKNAPSTVLLSDVRIQEQKASIRADMHQEYADSRGGGDIGLKTLTFRLHNGMWLIVQEDWSPLPDETGN